MKIFLSYASEQHELAKEIALALGAENHTVFFDRAALSPGEAYNAQIREAIEACQLFVFLVSPHSVSAGRYTLTELDFAEHKWPKPWGYVLSVMVLSTPKAAIPPYLRAGTLLQPSGNIAATVVAEVHRMPGPGWRRVFRRHGTRLFVLLLSVVFVAGGAWWGYERYREIRVERAALVRLMSEATIQQDGGHYAAAWKVFEQARSLAPENLALQVNEAKLAMAWIENARVTGGQGSFAAIVDKVLPALSTCSASPDKRHAANCLAHIGWGDFLKSREGQRALKPQQFYQRALALDPANAYAHAMWGFHTLETRGSLDEAKGHFERALAGGQERPYVRRMQIMAFLYYPDERFEEEAMRVVNDMRLKQEPLPPDERNYSVRWSKLWNIYYARILNGTRQQSFLSALSPADHLATFQWIFPENSVPEDKRDLYRFFLGSFQALGGNTADALATFNSLQKSWGMKNVGGRLPDKTAEAIKRLSKASPPENTKKSRP